MSSDLFAAFSSTDPASSNAIASNDVEILPGPTVSPLPSSSTITADVEDDFGDFEDASAPVANAERQKQDSTKSAVSIARSITKTRPLPFSSPPPKQDSRVVGRHPFADHMDLLFSTENDHGEYDAGADEMTDLSTNPQAAMEYSKRLIAQQQAEEDVTARARSTSKPVVVVPQAQISATQGVIVKEVLRSTTGHVPKDPNVLFDADDLSEDGTEVGLGDDDFGDFEGAGDTRAPVAESSATIVPSFDLLSLEDDLNSSKSSIDHNRHQSHIPSTPNPISKLTISAPKHSHDETLYEDAWDDFEDSPATTIPPTAPSIPQKPPGKAKLAQPLASAKPRSDSTLPPTNIPPPSILLSIFPSLFRQADEALFAPLSKVSPNDRQVLISHPASHKFLANYLTAGVVLGHIIAGRKSRWKRDQYLAQGMRIGPAGGKGGMKLAGVDKFEVAKEDREVVDAVRLWKAQIGKLRGAVAVANSTKSPALSAKLSAVPNITEQMPVKTVKAMEGGITAPHACALCGLRREERVIKVDGEVGDSFGEFWVDRMSMHTACRTFWVEHEGSLRSR